MNIYWKTINIKFGGSYKIIVKVNPCCNQCITNTDKLTINSTENKYHLITITDKKCENDIARFCNWCGAKIEFHEIKCKEFDTYNLKENITAFVDAIRRILHFRLNGLISDSISTEKEKDIRGDIDLAFNNLLIRLDIKD